MKSLEILVELTFNEDNLINETESKFKKWMENGKHPYMVPNLALIVLGSPLHSPKFTKIEKEVRKIECKNGRS